MQQHITYHLCILHTVCSGHSVALMLSLLSLFVCHQSIATQYSIVVARQHSRTRVYINDREYTRLSIECVCAHTHFVLFYIFFCFGILHRTIAASADRLVHAVFDFISQIRALRMIYYMAIYLLAS